MQELHIVQQFIIWIPPVLLAITLHEVAHGRVALFFGDSTAQSQGRLSLNPLRHIDPIGTVLVPSLLYLSGGFLFGWAKPVPVNYNQLGKPKRDMALVSLAGPAANIVMAIIWALLLSLGLALTPTQPWLGEFLLYMGQAGLSINVVLAVLNMLPVPPLDGSKILVSFLPDQLAARLWRIEPLGLIVLVALMATGLLSSILLPPVEFVGQLIISTFVF